ncbi:MAG TPA: hypothetical protein VF812_04605 [Ktedonobacterales bacterium]
MNIMELLLLVDERLRPLVGADERVFENALQVILAEVAAGPRQAGVAPDADPRAVLAGQLVDIEEECRMLRERLHVQLTVATRIEVKAHIGPARPRQEPAPPNEPDEAE